MQEHAAGRENRERHGEIIPGKVDTGTAAYAIAASME